MSEERTPRSVWAQCERALFGLDPTARAVRPTLLALAERAPDETAVDRYGEGELAERLEQRVATLLGKEAAVWMPSGTMAQQIALRIHADRAHTKTVAFHAHCHLDNDEERAYQWLHDLRAVIPGEPHRLLTADDVEQLRGPVAALLLELPQRHLGGLLPEWDELVATCGAARSRGAALHLDGARLWQCAPFYGRPLEEIAALFDTVYVSFYKDLDAPAGCALAGPRDVIDEARVWQLRHGGRLFSAYPYLLAAERGLDERLPRMEALVERTRELGAMLAALDGLSIVPDPPQTAMFHVLARRPFEPLRETTLDLSEASRLWFGGFWRETEDPAVQRAELTVTAASFDVPLDEGLELWSKLLVRTASAAG